MVVFRICGRRGLKSSGELGPWVAAERLPSGAAVPVNEYLTKLVSFEVLLARAGADDAARRRNPWRVGGRRPDASNWEAQCAARKIELT